MGKHIKKSHFGDKTLLDLFHPETGIVNYVAEININHSDPEVFVTAATACSLKKIGIPVDYKISGSGAGISWEDAYYAAIGETIERYSLSIIHPEDLVFATAKELKEKGLPIVEPKDWSLFDESQNIAPYVMFDENVPVTWVLADSIVDKVSKYVPACFVYLPYYSHYKEEGEKVLNASLSTGASCATSAAEATLKGLCELIERDAFMIMWKNQLPCPKISIDKDSGIYELYTSKFMRPGLQYDIYCTTMDLGIHSFFGVLTDYRGEYVSRVVGGAAHPDPEKAVLKTLLELVQGHIWKIYKDDVDFPIVDGYTNVKSFTDRMELYAYNDMSDAFKFQPKEATLTLSRLRDNNAYKNKTIEEILAQVTDEFRSKGYDVLGVNLTSPEAHACGVNIVKVLTPALELMDGDYTYQYLGGKRWKEVPYAVGLKSPKEPVVLNSYPHPYP
ncbi:MAG: YcaO-like family protein [Flavipsychrobacter sp.]